MSGDQDARCPAARRGGEPLPSPNARQMMEIARAVALFGANPEAELLTWRVIDPAEFLREGQEARGIHVEFLYRAADEEAGYRPGREVTVLGEDGTVLDSQDFG